MFFRTDDPLTSHALSAEAGTGMMLVTAPSIPAPVSKNPSSTEHTRDLLFAQLSGNRPRPSKAMTFNGSQADSASDDDGWLDELARDLAAADDVAERKPVQEPQRQQQVPIDDSQVHAAYANFCPVTGSPEEQRETRIGKPQRQRAAV